MSISISRVAEVGKHHLQNPQITTLLPFLYSTRTIAGNFRGRSYATYAPQPRSRGHAAERDDTGSEQDVSHRHQSYKPSLQASYRDRDDSQVTRRPRQYNSRNDHIPFDNLPRAAEDPEDELAGSTITPSERRSFEGLFKLQQKNVNSDAEPQQKQPAQSAPDDALEAILSGVEKDIRDQERRERQKLEMPKALKAIQQKYAQPQPVQRTKMEQQLVEQDEAKQQVITVEIRRVRRLLETAKVDVEVWEILQTHVFQRLKALSLEPPQPDSRERTQEAGPPQDPHDRMPADAEILPFTAPIHLERALQQLRHRFPGSPLAHAVLPTLRSLGPSAMEVGASTRLFNAHMQLVNATQPANLLGIVDVLEEMDKLVYEFDGGTLDILKKAEQRTIVWLSGRRGEGGRAVFRSPAVRAGMRKLRLWIADLERRLQESALRKAVEQEAMQDIARQERYLER